MSVSPRKEVLKKDDALCVESFNKKKCDVVKLKLQGREETVEVVALSFLGILSPLPRVVELHQCTHLQELDLSERFP